MGRNNKANMYVDILPLHQEVTGSCMCCTVRFPSGKKVKFLVDCGLFQEEKYQENNLSFPFKPEEIDFALVTHNHIDHIGRIPKVYRDGFKGKTYASRITSELMPFALNNTAEILTNNTQRNSQRSKQILENSSIPVFKNGQQPLFDVDDVEYSMSNVIGVEYNQGLEVSPHIAATFIQNAHLFGAASILVTITYAGENPIYLLFTGDYAKVNVFFDVLEMQDYIKDLPINIIQESTYGASSKTEIVEEFESNIVKALEKKGTIVIPVFSLGRAQEMLLQMKTFQDKGVLPRGIPIRLDGNLAQSYTKFYLNHLDELAIKDFLPENLTYITGYDERTMVKTYKGPQIILTTSGMGSYGPAQTYLPYYISDSKATIHFCGYTTPNTLGSAIREAEYSSTVTIGGSSLIKRADVYATNQFSGHAKVEDLIDYLKQFTNLRSVSINHGETLTKSQYAKTVEKEVAPKSLTIFEPGTITRIGAFGIIKTFPAPVEKEVTSNSKKGKEKENTATKRR